MSEESTKIRDNPYQSPLGVGPVEESRLYPSALDAFWAGAKRGAKFGAKWTALILGSFWLIMSVFVFGTIVYYRVGDEKHVIEGVKFLSMFFFLSLYVTLDAAAIGAIVMGAAKVSSYRRAKRGAATPITR